MKENSQVSLELHPDKVGDDPVKIARFYEVREASDALTKQRAAYDKAIENQELNEMAPRCEAFMVMMYFWILHSLIDWVQIEDAIIAMKKQLRTYILQDRKLDTKVFGIEPEVDARAVLKKYCEVSVKVSLITCRVCRHQKAQAAADLPAAGLHAGTKGLSA